MTEEIPEINQRLKQLIDFQSNGNVSSFSKKINISQQKVNRLLIRDKKTGKWPSVTTDIVISITNIFVDINISWFLTGKGDMLLRDSNTTQNTISENYGTNISFNKTGSIEMNNDAGGNNKGNDDKDKRIAELEAENKRLRDQVDKLISKL